jgi:ribosomal protein S14|tara:strand:+ start:3303 stop:3602 length:300 start_codon:yes stop_codon:yes gene_type:complete
MRNLKYNSKTNVNIKNRNLFLKTEILNLSFFALKQSNFSDNLTNLFFYNKLYYKSMVTIKNRCLLSSNSRSVFSKFKLSRNSFRRKALFGFLPGVFKSV